MDVAVFSTKSYDRRFLDAANRTAGHGLTYLEFRLTAETAVQAAGHDAVCVFVNDELPAGVLKRLAASGVRLVALRCAGFNNVDLAEANALGIAVARVPAYSPHAVAEHAVALILTLNSKTHRAYARVREGNFALDGRSASTFTGAPSASSAPARSAPRSPASWRASAAGCSPSIPVPTRIAARWAPFTGRFRTCSRSPTWCRSIARSRPTPIT